MGEDHNDFPFLGPELAGKSSPKPSPIPLDQFRQHPAVAGIGYLASPYSSGADEGLMGLRAMLVQNAMGNLIAHGLTVVSPVALTHDIARRFRLAKDYETWLHFNDKLLKACSYMIIYQIEGWDTSRGVGYERHFFQTVYKPIFLLKRFVDVFKDPPVLFELDQRLYQSHGADK